MLRLIDVAYIVRILNVACTRHIYARSVHDRATSPKQHGKEDSKTGGDYKQRDIGQQ